jgi:hypothetical protein
MQSLFELPELDWELGLNLANLKIYRKRVTEGSLFMVKCFVRLPMIPKEIAFRAVSDLRLRKKWDDILSNMKIIDDDKVKDTVVFYYTIPTPAFVAQREALVLRKVMKDFPVKGALSIHHKSTEHE